MNPIQSKFKILSQKSYSSLFLIALFMMVSGDFPRHPFGIEDRKFIFLIFSWPKLYIVLFCFSFLLYLNSGEEHWQSNSLDVFKKPVFILSTVFLISSILASNIFLGMEAFFYYLCVLFFQILFSYFLENTKVSIHIHKILVWAVLFLSVRVIFWRVHEGLDVGTYHIRNNAWLGKLQISLILNIFTPYFLTKFLNATERRWIFIDGAVWLLSGLAILTLYARAGAIIFIFSTVLICILLRHLWKRIIILTLLIAMILIPLSGAVHIMFHYVTSSVTHLKQNEGMTMRKGIWKETIAMFCDHPFFGIGLGNYDDAAYSVYHTKYDIQKSIKNNFYRSGWHAHNLFLHILAETGILGFFAWLYLWYTITIAFLIKPIRPSPKLSPESLAPIGSILVFFILSLFENLTAVRVHESLRMNLTFYFLLLVYYHQLTKVASSSHETTES